MVMIFCIGYQVSLRNKIVFFLIMCRSVTLVVAAESQNLNFRRVRTFV